MSFVANAREHVDAVNTKGAGSNVGGLKRGDLCFRDGSRPEGGTSFLDDVRNSVATSGAATGQASHRHRGEDGFRRALPLFTWRDDNSVLQFCFAAGQLIGGVVARVVSEFGFPGTSLDNPGAAAA